MSNDIGVFVEGDRALEQKFDGMSRAVHDALAERLFGTIGPQLYASVEALIPRKSGDLASKLVLKRQDSQDRIAVVVTLTGDFAKAGALEYGGTGKSFRVRAHQARLTHLWGRATGTPMLVTVPDHSRAFHTPGARFLRGPLESMRGEAEAEMREAVDQATAE